MTDALFRKPPPYPAAEGRAAEGSLPMKRLLPLLALAVALVPAARAEWIGIAGDASATFALEDNGDVWWMDQDGLVEFYTNIGPGPWTDLVLSGSSSLDALAVSGEIWNFSQAGASLRCTLPGDRHWIGFLHNMVFPGPWLVICEEGELWMADCLNGPRRIGDFDSGGPLATRAPSWGATKATFR